MGTQQEFNMKKAFLQLTAIIAGMFMVILDSTVVNVTMSKLTTDMHSTLSTMQWTITGYTLAVSAVIPLAGWLIDRFGAKKMFLLTIAFFTLGSLLCSFANSPEQLIIYRVIQGLGGGMVAPIGMAIVFRIAPPNKVGALMGMLGVPMLLAPALGPVIAGYFVEYQTWQWIFLINIPVGIFALIMGIKFLPTFKQKEVPKLDLIGMILAPIAFSSLAYGVSQSSKGWTEQSTVIGLTVGLVALILFIIVELRHTHPLLELKVFKSSGFTLGAITTWLMQIALFGMFLIIPLYLQTIKHYTPLETGLVIFPQAIASGLMMPISGKLYDKIGARPLGLVGLAIITGTLISLSNLDIDSGKAFIVLHLISMGLGMGISMMALNTHVLQSAPKHLVNRVTPLTTATQQVMVSFATAGMVSFLTSRGEHYRSKITNPTDIKLMLKATVDAFGDTFLLAAGVALLGWLIVWFLRKPKADIKNTDENQEANATMMAGH
ncbi:DHA2 family efflux MFS transporter permease subunit [Bacillus paramycoides]|uniref:DHA2 family efflux MFS transporter permease subunit n=1 Tax=Bacillus paramycoides TaxID=2026194 RepID=UPI002E2477F1|nr:DHA2 family efflux MFS transporter permease subunit [Bacillus paramycoides]MED0970791.1 DHA2 family efflux MFS transporter permease subunit [Bacillus paramycoides]MED0982667.1 DHA2 family efflux MFS transporter permease subunit [Bacillus paramycoides]